MITGMGGRETRVLGTVVGEETHRVRPGRVVTRPEAENQVSFDEIAADEIADDNGHYKVAGPDQAFLAEIQGSKDQQEKIERIP
jgi:hypothetical protein